jgi:hypothetical protein
MFLPTELSREHIRYSIYAPPNFFCLLDQNNLQDNKFLNKKKCWMVNFSTLSSLTFEKSTVSSTSQALAIPFVHHSLSLINHFCHCIHGLYKNILKSNSQKIHHSTWKLQKFAFHKLTSYKKFQNWKDVIRLWPTGYYAVTPSKT